MWRIYVSVYQAIIGSDNDLSPVQCQAIIWNNTEELSIAPQRNKIKWNFNHNSNIFIQENAFENVVCEMAAFLSLPQLVKYFKLINQM